MENHSLYVSPTQEMDEVEARVCILYCGGTIGMAQTDRGYAPVKGWMEDYMQTLSQFQDPDFKGHRKVTPKSIYGKRTEWAFVEYEPLLDSSVSFG